MTKTPPQNPYPTPQTTRQRLKPALQLETPSPTRSPGSSDTLVSSDAIVSSPEPEENLGPAFEAQDVVARFADPDLVLPIPKLVSLGAQSAGKSTMLSALLNITLWSAPEKSTFGATWINSRHTPGSFHAEIWIEYALPAHGVPKRVQFTLRAIEDKRHLELALKLAGDEARRSLDGMLKIRTYEALCGMTPEEQQQGHKDWPRSTVNTVILHVRGPEQPNLTVIDLPGLIREEECQLAESYVRDKNNMILYCVPGGTQPSDVAKETRLIKKYGQESGGVACVITKAHAIDYVHEDPHILLALGINPDISLEASLGWYCVRLRKREEAGMSPQIVQMAEASLFAQPDWRAIQERRALTLGIAQTKSRLLEAFARRVKANIPVLRQYMEEQKSAVAERLSRLPPVVANPIGGAHDLIIELAAQLEDTLYTQNQYTRRLLEAQQAFTSQLKATVPTFVATFKPHIEDAADSTTAQTGLRIYLDDTLPAVRKNTSARTDAANLDRVRRELRQQRCVDWPDLCRAYINNVWDITNQAVETIVAHVCEERNATCAELPALLAASQRSFKTDALDLAQRLCQCELTDPLQVSLPSPHVPVYAATRERLRKEFSEAFEIPPTSPTRENVEESGSMPPDVVAAAADGRISWVERKRCLDVEATLATTLDRGRHRLADVIGRQAQVGVKEWCRQVVPSLRKDMGLEELGPKTRKRAREMFEPDLEVAEERARCLRQLEVFRELQSKLPV